MKKIFTLIAVAAFAVACNNTPKNSTEATEGEAAVTEVAAACACGENCTCPEGECTCTEGNCACNKECAETEVVAETAETAEVVAE